MISLLNSTTSYSGSEGVVHWEGRVIVDKDNFTHYIQSVVIPRFEDQDPALQAEILALATTRMQIEYVEEFFTSISPRPTWRLGEAFAECALRDDSDLDVVWPWNIARDYKTPMASLTGADLVGFCTKNGETVMLFGEIKTSSDKNSPPRVMNDMKKQLTQIFDSEEIKASLIKWVRARCNTDSHGHLFREATKRYFRSLGKEFLLVGVLIRDTQPKDTDIKKAGQKLASHVTEPTSVELRAWYSPVEFTMWNSLMEDSS